MTNCDSRCCVRPVALWLQSSARMTPLLRSLLRELVQAETSAMVHCRREARRLGQTGPAQALLAVSRDAEQALAAMPFRRDWRAGLSALLGRGFSLARQVVDRLVDEERAYRGTLLGMRHGVDLVLLLREAALAAGELGLQVWCEEWLARRRPLVDAAVQQLSWFATRPRSSLASLLW